MENIARPNRRPHRSTVKTRCFEGTHMMKIPALREKAALASLPIWTLSGRTDLITRCTHACGELWDQQSSSHQVCDDTERARRKGPNGFGFHGCACRVRLALNKHEAGRSVGASSSEVARLEGMLSYVWLKHMVFTYSGSQRYCQSSEAPPP